MKYFNKILLPLMFIIFFISCSMFNKGENKIDMAFKATGAEAQKTTFNGDTLIFRPGIYDPADPEFSPPEFILKINDKQIVITGYYLASGGFKPVGDFTKNDNEITVTIHMPENQKTVPSTLVPYLYDLYLSNLTEKELKVTIIHKNDALRANNGQGTTVFSKKLVVPVTE